MMHTVKWKLEILLLAPDLVWISHSCGISWGLENLQKQALILQKYHISMFYLFVILIFLLHVHNYTSVYLFVKQKIIKWELDFYTCFYNMFTPKV